MADGLVQVPPDSTGKKVDTSELTVGANTVERQRIVVADSTTAAALGGVTNTAPTGAAYGLNVRNIPEKLGQTLSTTNLAGNGVFTQAWQDANADGTTFVEAQAFANQASATNGFVIQETDDSGNASLTRTITQASVSASTLSTIWAPIRGRFWRVQYTNGASAQTSFEITCSASPGTTYPVNASGVLQTDGSAVTQPVSGTVTANAGTGSFTVTQATAANLKVDLSGTAANATAIKVDGSAVTQPVSGTVGLTAGQAVELLDSGGTNKASISAAGAVKVDGSAVTQPVSGTVTANIGTSGSLALDASVTGLQVAQASTTSGQKGGLVLGAVTTAAPTYTTAQTDPLSLTTAGALRVDGSGVTQPVSGTVTANAGTGSFTVTQTTAANLKVDLSGTAANATAIKVDGSAVTQPVSGTVTANLAPATSGGCSDYHTVAAATTNAANIKASAGQIYTVSVFNNAAYPVFVKFYNTAGTPTVGTGVVHTVGVQAGTLGGWSNPQGFAFSTGIGISITKGITDADATAVAANDCTVDVQFK